MPGATAFPTSSIIGVLPQRVLARISDDTGVAEQVLIGDLFAAWLMSLDTEPPPQGGPWLDSGVLTVAQPVPPVIVSQPQNSLVEIGQQATFAVTASNAAAYQWRLNGIAIEGATENTYETPAATLIDDGGSYDCVVTGPGGTVISDAALLLVPDDVWYLPDPADESKQGNTYRLQGTTPIIVRNDGSKWFNIGTGEEVTLWWLPQDAVVHADFEHDRFFVDGSAYSKSELLSNGKLVDNGDGTYTLIPSSPIDFASGEQVIVYDYQLDFTSTREGTLWQVRQGTGNTGALRARVTAVSTGVGQHFTELVGNYYATSNQTCSMLLTSIAGESASFPGYGRHRILARLKNGEQVKYQPDNGEYRDANPTAPRIVGTVPNISRILFNCAWNVGTQATSMPLSGGALHRWTMYTRDLSIAERDAAGRTGIAHPIHILGDSFVTNGYPQQGIAEMVAGYLPASSDAVGGSTLAEQVVRYLGGTAKWHKSTLAIADMGYSVGMVEALLEIIPHIKSGRWIVLESAPQTSVHEIGKPGRQDFLDAMDALAEAAGDRFVRTLEKAYLESDGSPEDVADVAKGLWPRSIKKSEVDFHPNAKGDAFMARIVKQALENRGWL